MSGMLRYPILLVHGMGFRDDGLIGYWGRIPAAIESAGGRVFLGGQDGNADIATNGEGLVRRIDEVLAETGAEKVNLIAHSKGGLDSRYVISSLGAGDRVASLTTLATPHHGSRTIDRIMKLPRWLLRFGCLCADGWFRLLGDRKPDTWGAISAFATEAAAAFNAANPDDARVYYQSYAFAMKGPFSDILMCIPNLVVRCIEGENDGLLPPEAVKWGEFRGVIRSGGRRGISHCDEIDLRRRRLGRPVGEGIADIVDLYAEIVEGLRERGL